MKKKDSYDFLLDFSRALAAVKDESRVVNIFICHWRFVASLMVIVMAFMAFNKTVICTVHFMAAKRKISASLNQKLNWVANAMNLKYNRTYPEMSG